MAQHLLIADLAAPLLLAGVRNPVLMFYLPRPALITLARSGWPRRAFRWLRQPLVAIPIYTLFLYGWHFSIFFEAAVRNPLVHALQHMSFIGIGILVWWSALNPKRRRVHGDLWKIPYLLGAAHDRDDAGDELRDHPRADLHRRVRVRRSQVRDLRARRPADRRRPDGHRRLFIMVFALCYFFYKASQEADRDEAREREALLT